MSRTMSWDEVRAFFAHDGVGLKVVSRSTEQRNCFDVQVAAVEVLSAYVVLTLVPIRLMPAWGPNFALASIKEIGGSLEPVTRIHLWVDGDALRLCLPMTPTFLENGGLHGHEKVDGSLTNISFFPPVSPVS